jgi:hypothetical protein
VKTAWIVFATLLALVASASACGGGGEGDAATPSPDVATERPTSSAELSITNPANGDRIAGDTARLEIDLQGAEIVDQTSTDLRPDEGHLHVVLDGTLVSMTSGTSQRLSDLAPGEHLLQVEFVANDHAPFDPRVLAAVTFEEQP